MSRKVRSAGLVLCMGEKRLAYSNIFQMNLRRRGHLEDQGIDGKTILN
jgi:hypothetical protein